MRIRCERSRRPRARISLPLALSVALSALGALGGLACRDAPDEPVDTDPPPVERDPRNLRLQHFQMLPTALARQLQ